MTAGDDLNRFFILEPDGIRVFTQPRDWLDHISLNLIGNRAGYDRIRAGELLNPGEQFFCPLIVVCQIRVKMIKIRNRSGKQTNCIAALTRLNRFDGSNGSRRFLTVRTLNRLLHLPNDISHLALCMAALKIPTYPHSQQQRNKGCNQCFHAQSGLTGIKPNLGSVWSGEQTGCLRD
jgi:hypothetical protein